MDIVLGLSMTPAAVRMVLVEGQNADGVTIEERQVAVDDALGSATDHLVTTVRDVRAAAAAGGNRVSSIGVTWTDGLGACVVSEALAACDADNVTPISPFVAATTLAQAVAVAMGYERIAMLFADAESVSMAIVEAADAAIAEIRDEPLDSVDALSAVRILGGWVEALSSRPGGVFVIGSGMDICGFDIVTIKRELETVTSLAVNGPEEPDTALARGAALASANASLHVLSTDAFAYARVADPVETGPDAVTLSRFDVPTVPADAQHIEGFAHSLSPDGDTDVLTTTAIATAEETGLNETLQQRRPVLLVGSVGAVTLITGIVALEVSLALGIRPAAVGLQHIPGQGRIMPAPLMQLAPLAVAAAPRPVAMRPSGPPAQLPPSDGSIPLPHAVVPGDGPGAIPALVALPALMPNPVPPRAPDAAYPNYPILLPLPVASPPTAAPSVQQPSVSVTQPPTSQPVTSVPVTSAPPPTVPVTQPPTSQPVTSVPVTSAPVTTVPVTQPPTSQPVTSVPATSAPPTVPVTQPPVSQPPTTVAVTQPPTYVPVSQPPRPVPVAPQPVPASEPQLPVSLPAPEGPVIPGQETPTVRGPALEVPTVPASPGIVVPAQDVPPVTPQLPGSLNAPASEPAPSTGGGGAPFGGSGGPLGGGGAGTAGVGPSAGGGGSTGGGSLGGGATGGGGSSIGGSSSIGGGSSTGGGSSSTGGGSSSIGGGSSGSSGGSSGGGRR